MKKHERLLFFAFVELQKGKKKKKKAVSKISCILRAVKV